jgi:hypothetical protein
MVTVQGHEKRYEVRSELYGTRNLVHRLYYGGIYLTTAGGINSTRPALTMAEAIVAADKKVEELGIQIVED